MTKSSTKQIRDGDRRQRILVAQRRGAPQTVRDWACRSRVPIENAVRLVTIEVVSRSEWARSIVLVVVSFLHSFRLLVRSRAALHREILALRHQLAIANRSHRPRLRFTTVDRLLWAWLSQRWPGWRAALHVVQPATVLAWHRRGFRLFWTWQSRHRTGRPG